MAKSMAQFMKKFGKGAGHVSKGKSDPGKAKSEGKGKLYSLLQDMK